MRSIYSRIVGKCRRCQALDNDARLRQDLSQYKMMLQSLRRSEELFKDGSKIAFLIQVRMMYFHTCSTFSTQLDRCIFLSYSTV